MRSSQLTSRRHGLIAVVAFAESAELDRAVHEQHSLLSARSSVKVEAPEEFMQVRLHCFDANDQPVGNLLISR